MERFQKIRNNRRKFDISSICRFCGLENDERYNILHLNEDGVEFVTKVSSMIGIKVHGADKMPQNVCFICMDKINDFYEFRLMALNTEKQTRDALGLPMEEPEEEKPQPKPNVKKIIETKPVFVKLVDLKHSTKDSYLIQKALEKLNQKNQEQSIPSTYPVKREPTPSTSGIFPPNKKSRKDISCTICRDTYFSYITDLQDHQIKEHLPLIAKYACGSCRETFDQLSDFKTHESIHMEKKQPYICYFCKMKFSKLKDFQKHMTYYNCPKKKRLPVLVEDIKCFQCKKKYLTQNLFEWHGCFLKTRGTCAKCGLFVQKKKALLKHYVLCKKKFIVPEAARDPNADNAIKAEDISTARGSVINISNVSNTKPKGVRKKTVPQRGLANFKAEREVNLLHQNEMINQPHQEPVEDDDDYTNYEEDITYDNFGSDEDDEEHAITNLEPVVQLQENQVPRIIDIKAEQAVDFEAVRQHTIETSNSSVSPQIIKDIKSEKAARQAIVSASKQKSIPELGIKPERSASENPVVQVLNPLAMIKSKPTARKKTFKLPQELAMKIKLEKAHSDSTVTTNEMRDEAEPDPEEEAQMSQLSVTIKEEQLESASKAVKVTSPPKAHKQFINPIALAMMRKKNSTKSTEPANNGSGLFVISAVTSMSETSTNGDSAEHSTNEHSITNDEVPPQNQEKTVDDNTQSDKLSEINSGNGSSAPTDVNPVMVEIPAEFTKSSDEVNPHSPVVATNEHDNNKPSSIADAETEEKTEDVATKTGVTGVETEAINAPNDDELDQLLQKYETENIADANDLQDSDLQDLLKFD